MNMKMKLRILLGSLAAFSLVLVSFAMVISLLKDKNIILQGLGSFFYILHLAASMYFLYRFSISGQRMSSKLLVLNKFFVAANMGGFFLFLFLSLFGSSYIISNVNQAMEAPVQIFFLIVIAAYIIYQENNTWNFLPTKKIMARFGSYNKKNVNQMVGIIMMYLFISALWLFPMFGIALPVLIFMSLCFIIIQNSLAYTTFGQNRYWNFTFEITFLLNLSILTNRYDHPAVILLVMLIHSLFFYRQWKMVEYKKISMRIGIVFAVVFSGIIYFVLLPQEWNHSNFIALFSGMYLTIFAIPFIIEKQSFNK
ncbi:MAG: hypothetical protein JW708_03850 [Vallitaleaceae bacterium]|nr:hypothetical protein [Vallitaleaceae bacterium]